MKKTALICACILSGAAASIFAQDAPKKPREKIEIIAEMRTAIEKSAGDEKYENMKSLAFFLLHSGKANALDRKEAQTLLKNAADSGYVPAMADYGIGMWTGEISGSGIDYHMFKRHIKPEERAEGFKYTKMAAERGDANATAMLYHIYTTPPSPLNNYEAALKNYFSPQKAFAFLEKNLDLLENIYVTTYADHLMTGFGCKKDPAKAAKALENANLKSDKHYLPYIQAQIDARLFYIYEYILSDAAKAAESEKRILENPKGPFAAAEFLSGNAGSPYNAIFDPRNPNALRPDFEKARKFHEIFKKSEEYKNFPQGRGELLSEEKIREECIMRQDAWDKDFYITKRMAEGKMTFGGKNAGKTRCNISDAELEETMKKAEDGNPAAQFDLYIYFRGKTYSQETTPADKAKAGSLALKYLYDSAFQCYSRAMYEASWNGTTEISTQSKYHMPTARSDATKFWLEKLIEYFPDDRDQKRLQKHLEEYPDPGVKIF